MDQNDFKQFRRSQIAELRPYVPGEDMKGIAISMPDVGAGSPKTGDMIARNPKNHNDKWLVAEKYFNDNFEPLPEDGAPFDFENGIPTPHKETLSRVSSIAAHYLKQNTREIEILIETNQAGVIEDIRTLAASCLSQDETSGQEKPTGDFFSRLKAERADLSGKLDGLSRFLRCGPGKGMDRHHWLMLERQGQIMSEYLAVLDERIADLQISQRSSTENDHAK
jgi:hypothetical protein